MANTDGMPTFDENDSYSSHDDYEVYVYDSLGSIVDLESTSRKVVSKVPLLKRKGPRGTN